MTPDPVDSILQTRTTVTDAENHATVSYSDIWGRTALVDAPDGPGVDYTYDVSDRLVEVTYGSATTMLQYDLAGRKLSMDDPDMGYWVYTYDALGQPAHADGCAGCTTSLTYDLINRLENKSYSGSCGVSTAAVTYTYDQGTNGVGQRTRMDYGSGFLHHLELRRPRAGGIRDAGHQRQRHFPHPVRLQLGRPAGVDALPGEQRRRARRDGQLHLQRTDAA